MDRVGLGADANPLAWILTAAKIDPPTRSEVEHRLRQLKGVSRPFARMQAPKQIRAIFHPSTLQQLLWLRGELSPRRRVDRFLLASLLGGLHGNANMDGRPRGLTVSMPNTFAMAPRYVSRYIRRHRLRAPEVNVLNFLAQRVERYPPASGDLRRGGAWRQDARVEPRLPAGAGPAKLIFTSPPYLQVMLYGKLNWIRHWLLGETPKEVDARLFSSGCLPRYLTFLRVAMKNMRAGLRDDGFICLVIGDVRRQSGEIHLAEQVAQECLADTDLRVQGIVVDRLPVEHKVSRIWGKTKGRATRTDRILVLTAPKARLPRSMPSVSWH